MYWSFMRMWNVLGTLGRGQACDSWTVQAHDVTSTHHSIQKQCRDCSPWLTHCQIPSQSTLATAMFNMHITYYIMLCYVSQFLHSSHTVPIQTLLLNCWLVTRQGNERKTSAVAAARRADAMRALQQMRLFIWHLCCTDVLHGSMFAASLLKEVGPRVCSWQGSQYRCSKQWTVNSQ